MSKTAKRKLIAAVSILIMLSLTAGIYLLTPVENPSGAEKKIAAYTRNKPKAEISIAVVTDSGTAFYCYGHGGKALEVSGREYEIGAISKTFLGTYLAKAALNGDISLLDRVSDVLPIDRSAYDPTVIDLATHTSAYGTYGPEKLADLKYELGINPYSGITAYDVITAMNDFRLTRRGPYPFSYSNLGAAVLGMMLAEKSGTDYCTMMTGYIQDELGLKSTRFASGDPVRRGWKWNEGDAYAASAGIVSTVQDMAEYLRMYLGTARSEMIEATRTLCVVNDDLSVGYMWGLTGNGSIIAHTGETSRYASQLLIDKEHRVAVAVLSNYPNDRYGTVGEIAQAVLNETNSLPLQEGNADQDAGD